MLITGLDRCVRDGLVDVISRYCVVMVILLDVMIAGRQTVDTDFTFMSTWKGFVRCCEGHSREMMLALENTIPRMR